MRSFIFIICCGVASLFLWGCASSGYEPPQPVMGSKKITDARDMPGSSWHFCRFKMVWPEGSDINFTADLLIAHAVIRPVLIEYASDIRLWRFHRRAARDSAGHQFSFMFFSASSIAGRIIAEIESSPVLEAAIKREIVEELRFDDPSSTRLQAIEATSDKSWSPAVQKTWPYYIMGVSAMWLELINEAFETDTVNQGRANKVLSDVSTATPARPDAINPGTIDVETLMEQYHRAESAIIQTWEKEGQHALLHHLNAIFGYKPMLIRKRIWF